LSVTGAQTGITSVGTLTSLTVTNSSTDTILTVKSIDTRQSIVNIIGNNQGTGILYVGKDLLYGGGIEYNGDSNPVSSGSGSNYITLFRRSIGTDSWTARCYHSSNNWEFRGNVTGVAFFATSDSRIKTNIVDVSNSSIQMLRKIQPKTYEYIDKTTNGTGITYGFIAQDIKQVLPSAISYTSNYIPSIYESAFIDDTIITLINKSTRDISNCKIKLVDDTKGEIISDVTHIIDDKTFIISKPETELKTSIVDICGNILTKFIRDGKTIYTRGSEEYTGIVRKSIFVYGHHVDNFHTINKDAIWTVLFASTKEIDKQLQEANKKIQSQDEKIQSQDEKIQSQDEKIQSQDEKINKLEQLIYKLQSDIDIINNKE